MRLRSILSARGGASGSISAAAGGVHESVARDGPRGPAEDDTGPSSVERVFGSQSEAIAFLEAHVEKTECGVERVLPGGSTFHPRRVPVARCLCDEQGWSINEWEVEGT